MSMYDPPPVDLPYPPPRRRQRKWILLFGGAGAALAVSCAGCFGMLAWIGTAGPDTAVYAGGRVPQKFIETMREVGALEDGEQVTYFYSDAMVDIRNGFYFVSDRRVVIYSEDTVPALVAVSFDEVEEAMLYREESFFVDSEIILELTDATTVSFPVSSEREGDVRFFEAIEAKLGDRP